jgi:hypothetical protein
LIGASSLQDVFIRTRSSFGEGVTHVRGAAIQVPPVVDADALKAGVQARSALGRVIADIRGDAGQSFVERDTGALGGEDVRTEVTFGEALADVRGLAIRKLAVDDALAAAKVRIFTDSAGLCVFTGIVR